MNIMYYEYSIYCTMYSIQYAVYSVREGIQGVRDKVLSFETLAKWYNQDYSPTNVFACVACFNTNQYVYVYTHKNQ